MPDFAHLHVHTQFSLLDGAANIKKMMKKAAADGQKAIALTDHGNMFGAFNFVAEATKNNLKPIVGCEFYMVEDRFRKDFNREQKDQRFHQLLLAKDQDGYQNLAKLCSLGYIEGLYSKWPRVDRELIKQYSKGLIATTCCIGAEVPQAILYKTEEEAEKVFKYWLDIFGEDYYIELQRHGLENIDGTGKSQEDVNQVLLKWAKKYNVNVIATNDSHYVEQEDSNAHDILLCVNTGELQGTPIGDGKGRRFGFPNDKFYFKSQAEMNALFADVPQAIDFTQEIIDKVTPPKLQRDILLPNFPIPEGFSDADDFLRHLTYEGAKRKYKEVTPEIEERLNYELHIIKTMGFGSYFLIVSDFCIHSKKIGVEVGPGRGSAAGSAVAFCVDITNIDPIKYNLLFERFLNPERVSMPDIDTDFDDEGRQKVIDYVVEKYGKNQVAQIITYGSMAAKSSIKDVARVLDLPLAESNILAKLVPDKPGTSLERVMTAEMSDIKKEYGGEDIDNIIQLREIAKGDDMRSKVIREALLLEGSVRNTGIHAAGVIIAPDDITNYIPVMMSKESELLITQYDGKVIESAGMLKMDFLGLKTLTIIRDALRMIKKRHATDINIDEIPLDDPKTFALYQRGDTVGTFQFESDGMRKYLKELKPTDIEDLIAMNALYRPGPMDYIPTFINRKHGKEKVEYPHELLEGILSNTYGIMVYQEQIMQTAQIIAGYSLGGADLLRRAMGKKDKEKMAKEREKFVKGAKEIHNIEKEKANDIFDVMEKFAEYGFNRSHSAAYSVVAYQTAYLKANYPAEYMASVLTHNMGNIEKITFFMDECRKQDIPVLGPDVNESALYFDVNKEGKIRFGLGAIKGSGEAAVEAIITEREETGAYKDIFEFAGRINLRSVNKKTWESLAQAGGFDCFTAFHRAQYFHAEPNEGTFIERLIKYGNAYQSNSLNASASLFGGTSDANISTPKVPDIEPWISLDALNKEKEVVGFYITGHPLDDYKMEIDFFTNTNTTDFKPQPGRGHILAGIISKVALRKDKRGNDWAAFTLEDYKGNLEFRLFSDQYRKFQNYMENGLIVLMKATGKQRYNGETEPEITDICLLAEVHEKMTKSITLKVDVQDVTDALTQSIEEVMSKYAGPCPVKVMMVAEQENLSVTFGSNKYKLQPSNDLFKTLATLRGVEVSLN
ncbi:MAG: DNA polymerase III subunit alpha [Bacteroidia bacterium]